MIFQNRIGHHNQLSLYFNQLLRYHSRLTRLPRLVRCLGTPSFSLQFLSLFSSRLGTNNVFFHGRNLEEQT